MAGAVLLIGGSYADTANNSFASVSGNGVVADGESGFCIKNVEGTVEITVNERPGWKCDSSGITEYDKLPKEAKDYIDYVEKLIDCPITMISTGPDRADMIYR